MSDDLRASAVLAETRAGVEQLEKRVSTASTTRELARVQAKATSLVAKMAGITPPAQLAEGFGDVQGRINHLTSLVSERLDEGCSKMKKDDEEDEDGKTKKKGKEESSLSPAGKAIIERMGRRIKELEAKLDESSQPIVDDERYETSIEVGERLLSVCQDLTTENAKLTHQLESAVELMEAVVGKHKRDGLKAALESALEDPRVRKSAEALSLLRECKTPEQVAAKMKTIRKLIESGSPAPATRTKTGLTDPLPPLGGSLGTLTEDGLQPARRMPAQARVPQQPSLAQLVAAKDRANKPL